MRSEIHLINLIKASERARKHVAELFDDWQEQDTPTVLRRLRHRGTPDALKRRLEAYQGGIFTKIAVQIERDIQAAETPPFEMRHLIPLLNNRIAEYRPDASRPCDY